MGGGEKRNTGREKGRVPTSDARLSESTWCGPVTLA